MKKTRSLNVTILKYFSILLIITAGAAAGSFYYGTTKIVLQYSDNVTKNLSDRIIRRTTNFLKAPADQVRVVSHLVDSPNIIADREQLWTYMWQQMAILPQAQSIFIADEFGNYVQVRNEPRLATRYIDRVSGEPSEKWIFRERNYNAKGGKSKTPTFDPRIRPWYTSTQTESRVYWTDVYLFTTAQTPGISATYPVLDQYGNKAAVVGVNIALHSLSDFLSELEVSKNGVVFITNANHELIAFPDASKLTTVKADSNLRRVSLIHELPQKWIRDAYDHYRLNKQSRFVTHTEDEKYITTVAPFPKAFSSEWKVFVIIPERDVLGSVNKVLLETLAIVAGIFFLSLLAMQLFSRRISRPIQQLALETQKIKTFDLDDVVKVDSNITEIDMMSKALMSSTNGLQSFRKYVPEQLVKQLIELGEEANVGGVETELTIFFSDIADFTSIAESMDPKALMAHLSEYFDALSNVIMNEHGTIDKYIGDAIMAFWGAPLAQENTPHAACRSALLCQKINSVLNSRWKEQQKPILLTRIGLHTGTTIVGNVGSKMRINYSVLGDSVNLAARLEGINKLYGTNIIISEDTYFQVKDDFFCRLLDVVAVKGKSKSIHIYELIGEADVADDELRKERVYYTDYENAFGAYLDQHWRQALEGFGRLLKADKDDPALLLMIGRCEYYSEHADELTEGWDGTTTLTKK